MTATPVADERPTRAVPPPRGHRAAAALVVPDRASAHAAGAAADARRCSGSAWSTSSRSVLLLVTAFWTVDSFTGEIITEWTLDNIITVLTGALYQTVTLRTLGVALLVTLIDVVLALPIAFYMAKVASPRAAAHPADRRADAAVGELPGQGVRLAVRAVAGRHPGMAARARWDCTRPATA